MALQRLPATLYSRLQSAPPLLLTPRHPLLASLALQALVLGTLLQALAVDTGAAGAAAGHSSELEREDQVLGGIFPAGVGADLTVEATSATRGAGGHVCDTRADQVSHALDES